LKRGGFHSVPSVEERGRGGDNGSPEVRSAKPLIIIHQTNDPKGKKKTTVVGGKRGKKGEGGGGEHNGVADLTKKEGGGPHYPPNARSPAHCGGPAIAKAAKGGLRGMGEKSSLGATKKGKGGGQIILTTQIFHYTAQGENAESIILNFKGRKKARVCSWQRSLNVFGGYFSSSPESGRDRIGGERNTGERREGKPSKKCAGALLLLMRRLSSSCREKGSRTRKLVRGQQKTAVSVPL